MYNFIILNEYLILIYFFEFQHLNPIIGVPTNPIHDFTGFKIYNGFLKNESIFSTNKNSVGITFSNICFII